MSVVSDDGLVNTPNCCDRCCGLWHYVFWLISCDNRIFQCAYLFYSDLNYITWFHGADAGWRAGGNDVAWQQRHYAGNKIDKLGYAEDEVAGRSGLTEFTVKVSFKFQI